MGRPGGVLAALCVTQVTGWGVLFYAFPVLAPTITDDTGWSSTSAAAAFSAALAVAAVAGVPVGRVLDRHGPRAVMTFGSVLAATATIGIAAAPTLAWFTVAWLAAGLAMSAVLYQPAFAALARWYGSRRVSAFTTLTLAAGLASTVFAPVTDALVKHLTWRGTYLTLAVVLATITIPLHAFVLRRPWPPQTSPTGATRDQTQIRSVVTSRPFVMLALSMTLSTLAMFAAMINTVPLLIDRGASLTLAAWALGLGGIGQVAGRLVFPAMTRALSLRTRTFVVFTVTAATTLALAVVPGPIWLLVAIAVTAGMARGITTLLQATATIDRWGTAAYGTLSGILAAPVTAATAVAPFLGTAIAGPLGGHPNAFIALGVVAAAAALLAPATIPPSRESEAADADAALR